MERVVLPSNPRRFIYLLRARHLHVITDFAVVIYSAQWQMSGRIPRSGLKMSSGAKLHWNGRLSLFPPQSLRYLILLLKSPSLSATFPLPFLLSLCLTDNENELSSLRVHSYPSCPVRRNARMFLLLSKATQLNPVHSNHGRVHRTRANSCSSYLVTAPFLLVNRPMDLFLLMFATFMHPVDSCTPTSSITVPTPILPSTFRFHAFQMFIKLNVPGGR